MTLQSIDKKPVILFYIFIFILLSTINNVSLNKSKKELLKIENIEITGLNKHQNEKIKKSLEYLKGKNIFFLNRQNIENSLNQIHYIENYKVSKHFPSKVLIDLEKTKLLAIVYQDNQKFYIGNNKKLISLLDDEKNNNLPIVFGNFSKKEFFNLKNIIDKSKFDLEQIKEYYYFPSKRWDIKLNNEITIKLPRENISSALNLLDRILKENIREHNNIIDLRVPNQIIFSNE
tara:strand:+ start:3321 stop:4016 length:696 start_codon:yes stop_codon:yes gene_type:complete